MTIHNSLYINGKWENGYGKDFTSTDPATGEIIWEGAAASPSDINRAIQAARQAFSAWASLSVDKRITYLNEFVNALEDEKNTLARAISQETGKPLWESLSEIQAMQYKVEVSVEAYEKRCSEVQREQPRGLSITRYKPHGVVGVLGPFNLPGHLPNGHIVPALLAGNTVVFKPSEYTPFVGELTVRCWEKAGLPPGVINLVLGKKEVGATLSKHENLNALFFTGNFTTGSILAEHFAKHPEKLLALEMGGNNPLVISKVADPHAAAYLTIQSAYITAGQRCSCARRLIVIESETSDKWIETLIAMIHRIKVSPYTYKPEPFMGPVISEDAVVQLLSKQAAWLGKGAKTLIELRHIQEGTGFVSPGLIDVTGIQNITDEEVFGPLLQLIRVADLDHAIAEANRTAYGLSAGIFSDNKEEYETFFRKVNAGSIQWNHPLPMASSAAPFGGIGRSGNFRPSAYYATDYCSYPIASLENSQIRMPNHLSPGLEEL